MSEVKSNNIKHEQVDAGMTDQEVFMQLPSYIRWIRNTWEVDGNNCDSRLVDFARWIKTMMENPTAIQRIARQNEVTGNWSA